MTSTIRDFLEIRAAASAGFSPDGSKVLVASNTPGTTQLYRVARTGGELRQITDLDEPASGAYLPDRDDVLVQSDSGGNERHQIYLVSDDGGELRPLVHDPEHMHAAGGMSRDGRLLAYACNRRNGVDFDVFVRDLRSGDERAVFAQGGWCSAEAFSPDAGLVGVTRLTERAGDNELYVVDVETGEATEVAAHAREADVSGPSWLPDGSGFFFSTDVDRECTAVAFAPRDASSWRYVLDGEWDASCKLDDAGRHLLVHTNEDGYSRLRLHDPSTFAERAEIPLPDAGVLGGAQQSKDGRYVAYTFTSYADAGDAWVYDTEDGSTTRLTTSPSGVPRETFVAPELHRFASFDGESIPVYLYLPRDRTGPGPCVVYVHGGPESQFRPGFNPVIQYLLHRGYAVAAPNVRGSTGYGRRFMHLDDVRKRLDSVADLASLHAWLSSHGAVDGERCALMGGSYGGYMTLAGLAFQPELWAAGVDIVGISSLVTFLENTSAYRRRFREREYGSLEHDRDFLIEASPITHVDAMRAPLLIIHGANDPRVPLGEAEQIHDVLRGKGVECEMLVYHDEGHGLGKLRNRLDAYPKVADFLDRVLEA